MPEIQSEILKKKKSMIKDDDDDDNMEEIDSKLRKSTMSKRISRRNESTPNPTPAKNNF